MAELCDVSITAPDADWLTEFTRRLVNDRLAASGNITSTVRSVYRWAGEVLDEVECSVILHTRRSLVPEIIRRTLNEHPYAVPGLRITPIETHPGYQQWIIDSTQEPTSA